MHINKLIFTYQKAGEYNYLNFTTGIRGSLSSLLKVKQRYLKEKWEYNIFSKDGISQSLSARLGTYSDWQVVPGLVQLKTSASSLGSQTSDREDKQESHEKNVTSNGEWDMPLFMQKHSFSSVRWSWNDTKSKKKSFNFKGLFIIWVNGPSLAFCW